ncbi:proline/glycine betaine ABC transporter ATP-binding protein [Arthrobacter sp. UCD-GKA]|uniref:ABC transporter ATP-binding protein n=1 Tax=Arthrobacter sp. UCD-GKA TaxID=1913576 RepID=UPI0008DE9CE5|nr:ATP-binding cassette domain-containing protein [Arthrobacter sp. UCD-GKA]OIH85106.1 proline/glycine betaine ABC transporter ATP-binding protein [Arthrobacter sp. UCD-GKA]
MTAKILASAHDGAVDVVFEKVSKRFPDGTLGVDNVDLTCDAGRITVFVGPSGCGKTTSLRMINRMIEPTDGRILIGDNDAAGLNESELRRGIGYVIQNAGLFPHRNILDNIATVPMLLGVRRNAARLEAAELLERVGLDPSLGRKYPYQLSGGQQQRVGVARALAANPPVLLMDEPFSAVDPVVRLDLQNELLRLQRDIGKTIIFVTHDMDEAIRLADHIVVFQKGGTIAQADTPEKLLTQPVNAFVRDFTGDSGVKWLSLMGTAGLSISREFLSTAHSGSTHTDRWRLAVDEANRAAGWLRPGQPHGTELIPCRRTFVIGADPMRSVLDSALLSPAGYAVAVDADGVVLGLTDISALEPSISAHRERVNV